MISVLQREHPMSGAALTICIGRRHHGQSRPSAWRTNFRVRSCLLTQMMKNMAGAIAQIPSMNPRLAMNELERGNLAPMS